MSLVKDTTKYMPPRSVGLRWFSGWCRYSKYVRALNLIAGGFGDMFPPADQRRLCQTCLSLPGGHDTLTVQVGTITRLLELQGCEPTRPRLTENGWAL